MLEILQATNHLFGFHDLMDQHERFDQLPDASTVWGAVGDPRMRDPLVMECRGVIIMRDKYPPGSQRMGDHLIVRR